MSFLESCLKSHHQHSWIVGSATIRDTSTEQLSGGDTLRSLPSQNSFFDLCTNL